MPSEQVGDWLTIGANGSLGRCVPFELNQPYAVLRQGTLTSSKHLYLEPFDVNPSCPLPCDLR
jgi:hypothetical protein